MPAIVAVVSSKLQHHALSSLHTTPFLTLLLHFSASYVMFPELYRDIDVPFMADT